MLLVVLAIAAIVGTAAYCMVCERIEANNTAVSVDPQPAAAPTNAAPSPFPAYTLEYFAPVHYSAARAPSVALPRA